mgnify:CR=1 FL=1
MTVALEPSHLPGLPLGYHWVTTGLPLGYHWVTIGLPLGYHCVTIGLYHWATIGLPWVTGRRWLDSKAQPATAGHRWLVSKTRPTSVYVCVRYTTCVCRTAYFSTQSQPALLQNGVPQRAQPQLQRRATRCSSSDELQEVATRNHHHQNHDHQHHRHRHHHHLASSLLLRN